MLKNIIQFFLEILFPHFCPVCGLENSILCKPCMAKLAPLLNQICPVCDKPSAFGKTHMECKTKYSLDGLISPLTYKDKSVRILIETYKYKMVTELSEIFSNLLVHEIMAKELHEHFKGFLIIPVPLHPKRLNWRGFNQAELLSDKIASMLNIKKSDGILTRIKNTSPQATLNKKQRKLNISGAFRCECRLKYDKVLLIDDVATTKSTLSECCKTLKKSGADTVWAATIAVD